MTGNRKYPIHPDITDFIYYMVKIIESFGLSLSSKDLYSVYNKFHFKYEDIDYYIIVEIRSRDDIDFLLNFEYLRKLDGWDRSLVVLDPHKDYNDEINNAQKSRIIRAIVPKMKDVLDKAKVLISDKTIYLETEDTFYEVEMDKENPYNTFNLYIFDVSRED